MDHARIRYAFDDQAYGVTKEESAKVSEINPNWKKKAFEIIVTEVASKVNPQGLEPKEARWLNRIFSKVDEAKDDTVGLSEGELETLRDLFKSKSAKVSPNQVRVFCALLDALTDVATPTERGDGKTS